MRTAVIGALCLALWLAVAHSTEEETQQIQDDDYLNLDEHRDKRSLPGIHKFGKSRFNKKPHFPNSKPHVPHLKPKIVPHIKPHPKHIPEIKQQFPHIPSLNPHTPHFPKIKPHTPHFPKIKPHTPHFPKIKPHTPHFPKIKPHIPHFPKIKPHVPHFPKIKPHLPHIPKGNPHFPKHLPHDPHVHIPHIQCCCVHYACLPCHLKTNFNPKLFVAQFSGHLNKCYKDFDCVYKHGSC